MDVPRVNRHALAKEEKTGKNNAYEEKKSMMVTNGVNWWEKKPAHKIRNKTELNHAERGKERMEEERREEKRIRLREYYDIFRSM